MDNQPVAQIMSKEENDAYWAKMSDPEYWRKRYEGIDQVVAFMDLCNKGAKWIVDIHNFCEAHRITPDQLMDSYSENKNQ